MQDPSSFSSCGPDCPVEMVSFVDAVLFANALSRIEGLQPCYGFQGEQVLWPDGLACTGYRLPTEAEWEYAAMGGGEGPYPGTEDLSELAWYEANSGGTTHPVGGKAPNGYGLHDMGGNVWEWVWDWYYVDAYRGGSVEDPRGPATGMYRVHRGGSWGNTARYARTACRRSERPVDRYSYVGFRLARSAPGGS